MLYGLHKSVGLRESYSFKCALDFCNETVFL